MSTTKITGGGSDEGDKGCGVFVKSGEEILSFIRKSTRSRACAESDRKELRKAAPVYG